MKKTKTNKKPWLDHYPKGVPDEINPEKFKNLMIITPGIRLPGDKSNDQASFHVDRKYSRSSQ